MTTPATLTTTKLLCATMLCFSTIAAQAQDSTAEPAAAIANNSAAERDELVVTARKRSESVQDIPLSITAVAGTQLEEQGIVRLEDLNKLTPTLTFDYGISRTDSRPSMRGLQAERGRPSVAVLLDGLDLAGQGFVTGSSASVNAALFDVERVEVVRGPQSVLYGRAAFAGAINYISRRPTREWESRVALEVGEFGLVDGRLSVSGPLTDTLAFRANVLKRDTNGFYKNPNTGQQLNAEDTLGGAFSLLWEPTENLSINSRYQIVDDNITPTAVVNVSSNGRRVLPGGNLPGGAGPCPDDLADVPANALASCTRRVYLGDIDADPSQIDQSPDPRSPDGAGFPGLTQTQQSFSTDIQWGTDYGDFTLLYGWLNNDARNQYDGDFANYPEMNLFVLSLSNLTDSIAEDTRQSLELRWAKQVGKVDIVAGVQYFDEDSVNIDQGQTWLRNPNSIFADAVFPPFLLNGTRANPDPREFPVRLTRDTEYLGVFASAEWQITDQLALTVEGRYHRDDIEYTSPGFNSDAVTFEQLGPPACPPAPPFFISSCGTSGTVKDSSFTPRISLDYALNDNLLVYATYAEGYKPGGINVVGAEESYEGRAFGEESVDTYEVGFKSELFERRVLFNLAGYYNKYTDQQIGVQVENPDTGFTQPFTVNAGQVDIYGAEMESTFRVTDAVTLNLSYAFTDAKFEEFIIGKPPAEASTQQRAEAGNVEGDFSGNEVNKTSRHAWNFIADYRRPVNSAGNIDGFVQVVGRYRSRRYTDETNLATLPAYAIADLQIGATGDRWSVVGYVNNMFDNDTIQSAQRFVDIGMTENFVPVRAYLAYLPPPRVVGLRTEFRF